MGQKGQPKSWRDALKIINRCPVCEAVYNADDARLFAEDGEASLVHITCGKCRSHFMALLMVMKQGLSSVGLLTDLTFDDLKRLQKAGPITLDEAIEAHEILEREDFTKQ